MRLLGSKTWPPRLQAYPIRRQIVWTYLSRSERRWEKLHPKELRRSVELLEANLQEEPSDDRGDGKRGSRLYKTHKYVVLM
jgi:hypothetical protein